MSTTSAPVQCDLRDGSPHAHQRTDAAAQDGVGEDAHAVHVDDERGVTEEGHRGSASGGSMRPVSSNAAARHRRYHRDVVGPEAIRSAPKVLLHDHLDGGLRPQTVIELAQDGRATATCPREDPEELGRWFRSGADRKSLELYLEGFRHTVARHADAGGHRPGGRRVCPGPGR